MKIADLNLLLYAVNRDAPRHEAARRWWEETLGSDEHVGLAWTVLLGFLRLSTRTAVMPKPLRFEQAARIIDEWLEQPACVLVHPGERHWQILKDLLQEAGTAGNLTTDAHLAALAIEHNAVLCSTDGDFRRFAELRLENPLA
jgi:toxin-antitoxin system PIN domain toxin